MRNSQDEMLVQKYWVRSTWQVWRDADSTPAPTSLASRATLWRHVSIDEDGAKAVERVETMLHLDLYCKTNKIMSEQNNVSEH